MTSATVPGGPGIDPSEPSGFLTDPSQPGAGVPGPVRAGRRLGRVVLPAGILTGGLLLAAVVVTVAVTTTPHRHLSSASLRGTVFDLHPGQCVNNGLDGAATANPVPCSKPHDAEVYAQLGVAGRRWPGAAAIAAQARAGCPAGLSGYLNPQLGTANLAESYIYPDQGAWAAGARSVICEVRATHGTLTGSVRG